MGLSNNQIKYIRSLGEKKFRNQFNTFVAEGEKLVFDLMESCRCQIIAALPETLNKYPNIIAEKVIETTDAKLKKATFLKTPPPVIAVFDQPQFNIDEIDLNKHISIVLDNIQDPGNVGTIIRIADWFGIDNIICSKDSADVYNPKTVQATMGSIARVNVIYTDIISFLSNNANLPVYGTFLNGNNIYDEKLSDHGFIVMGSEGKGISSEVEKFINKRLFIPNYPINKKSSESLNVAAATAIVCSELRRRS